METTNNKTSREPLYENEICRDRKIPCSCNSCDRIIYEDEMKPEEYTNNGGYCPECFDEVNLIKLKHTPGPWWRDDDGFVASGNGDTYKTIADPNCSDLDIDEREANCRLIAAAPEMLEALELIAGINEYSEGEALRCKETAKAIIAKINLGS